MEDNEQCPLCSSAQRRTLTDRGLDFQGERVQWCLGCGLCYLAPRMTPQQLGEYYADHYSAEYRGTSTPNANQLQLRDRTAQYRLGILQSWGLVHPGQWVLELGCGAGNFLLAARNAGMQCEGIEPSRGFGSWAQQQGLRVKLGSFPDIAPMRRDYNLVVLFHVLEHLPDPISVLTALSSRLSPEGRLIVEVPDLMHSLGPRWSEHYFHRPHLMDFSLPTLKGVLSAAGLAIESFHYAKQSGRKHHLLVAATKACSGHTSTPRHRPKDLKRLQRWIGISRLTRPLYRGLRNGLGRAKRRLNR